jgi:predicted Zn-dependent peptidase
MSKITEIKSARLSEKYFKIEHDSGLEILVYPKENYASSYVIFGTKYGSIDNEFKLGSDEEFTVVPEGIAHFLEHKLFESEELDAFERYAKTGASANAYTSFDRTCYLFSCSKNLKDNLEILMDFVTHPYFTEATVQKEQGIIGQEIKMTQDEPAWASLFSLLEAMYKTHPVKIEIAGTVESISHITADLLYKCYNTFYNFGNMVLCAVGNVDVDTVLSVADRVLKKQEPIKIERRFFPEPKDVNSKYVEKRLAVASPIFSLGFKENIATPERNGREVLISQLLLDVIAGPTSPLYNSLLTRGLINTSFDSEFFCGYGYSALLFSGESENSRQVADEIKNEIKKLQQSGISEADFQRVRKKLYGRLVMSFNDVDEIANNMIASYFADENLFDDAEVLSNLTLDEVNERLRSSVDTDCCSLCVVLPEEK